MKYTDLSSATYMQSVTREQKVATRKARNAKAIHDFTTFLMGLGAMYVGVFAVQHQNQWLPQIENVLSATGWF